jgi:outer membrane lipoprotein-sorting protein
MTGLSTITHTLLATLLVGLSAGPSPDLFDQLFARTQAKRSSLTSIRGRFTETTTSTLLEKPVVAHGTIVAVPPARVAMTYTDPERRTIVVDQKFLTISWPDRKEKEQIDIARTQKRIDHYFTQATIDDLRSMFEIAASADTAVRGAIRVDMRPKRKQIKEGLERLELWIDNDSLLLGQMRMTLAGGDTKTIKLDDVVMNVPVPDDAFRPAP